jgi:hypothetical protein
VRLTNDCLLATSPRDALGEWELILRRSVIRVVTQCVTRVHALEIAHPVLEQVGSPLDRVPCVTTTPLTPSKALGNRRNQRVDVVEAESRPGQTSGSCRQI